jgi:hypothetical protein
MFVIKWVAHRRESEPVEVENSKEADIGLFVLSCQNRLLAMRKRHAQTPPDGFLVFDEGGTELRRWFGTPRPPEAQ